MKLISLLLLLHPLLIKAQEKDSSISSKVTKRFTFEIKAEEGGATVVASETCRIKFRFYFADGRQFEIHKVRAKKATRYIPNVWNTPYVLIIASTKKHRMKYAHSVILIDHLHIEDEYHIQFDVKFE